MNRHFTLTIRRNLPIYKSARTTSSFSTSTFRRTVPESWACSTSAIIWQRIPSVAVINCTTYCKFWLVILLTFRHRLGVTTTMAAYYCFTLPLLPLKQYCLTLKFPAISGLARLRRESSIVSTLFEGEGGLKLVNMLDLPKMSVIHLKNFGRSNYIWHPL